MPTSFSPLIPLPNNTDNSPAVDPFAELLQPHLFSRSAKPISPAPIKTNPIPTPSNEAPDSSNNDVASPSSDFGAFVSVDPTDDPLNASTGFSPTEEHPPPPGSFVHEASERARLNGQRIMDELIHHEDDPLYFVEPTIIPPNFEAEGIQALLDAVEGNLIDISPSIDPHHAAAPSPADDNIEPLVPVSMPRNASFPSPAPSPLVRTSSLSHRLSQTLPRKWSNLLTSSPSPPLVTTHLPSTSPTQSSIIPDSSITHTSPFAASTYIPPSGAPGFDGDRKWNKGFEFTPAQKVGNPVMLQGRLESARPVLPSDIVEKIRAHLPPLFRLSRKWSLLYSMDQHGISIGTFYSRLAQHDGGCLLAIKDSDDAVFGVWMGEPIRRSIGRYYGSGESFLWRETRKNDSPAGVNVFKWTGKNDYVALCEPDYISFGGGDGKYGLYLDSTFFDGSSARCQTFDNDVLCSTTTDRSVSTKTVRFECVGMEVWGVSR